MILKSLVFAYCPAFLRPALDRVSRSPIGSRLVRGVFWTMAGAVISRGLMLCATVVVARILNKTVYGELGMIQSTVSMFGVFAGFGLGLTATKYVAEYSQIDPDRAGRIIGISGLSSVLTGGLMALGLLIFAPWLAENTINAPHLADELRIGALILFINALNGAQTGVLSGFEAFKLIAYVNFIVGMISFPMLVCGAWFGGLSGTVWALAVNLGINWLLNHFALRKEARRHNVPLTLKDCRKEWSVVWTFSLPAFLSSAMVGPVVWISNAILVNQENGYAALGVYSAAYQISTLIATANVMIGKAFLPICVSTYERPSPRFQFANIVLPWAIGIFCALPFLGVPELWALLLGRDYFSYDMLRSIVFVAVSSIIVAHRQGIARNFIARNYLWWSLLSNSCWGITAILCARYFSVYGAQGQAVAFAIAYSLNTLIFIPFYIRRKLCPNHILLSRYSILVWLILIFLATMGSLMLFGIAYRAAIVVLSYCLIFLLFNKMRVATEIHIEGKLHVSE
ncbi:MAG: oligosaccharide flippase family protein [Anaerolineae bacterium]|nr:oligosaccharide flippase family protein [Anaerolineae bacterium]